MCILQVLVEGVNPRNPAEAMGRSSHNKLCFFPGNGAQLKGSLVNVHIEEVRAYSLFGKIITPGGGRQYGGSRQLMSDRRAQSLVLA